MIRRRDFLRNSTLGIAGLAFARYSDVSTLAQSRTIDAHIEVLLNEPLGTISPNLYGHFTENLGGVIYDGIWVGETSKIANVNGIRKAVIDHMRAIKAPVVRFPGGCFADSYDWRDGIGPRDKRPRRTNFWANYDPKQPAGQKYDPNQFGTNEFVHFCKLVGAEPYLAANVRSLPAQQFVQWVEYCNSPAGSTTLADTRASAGFSEPFNVKYWGVGNESWGCGGNFEPSQYAMEFRRYVTWVPGFGRELRFVASGPDGDNYNWTTGFFEAMAKKDPHLDTPWGWALHMYAWNLSRGRTSDWDKGKGDAVNFDATDWYELLREGQKIETLIERHWQIMGQTDREHRVKLVVDEWGPWYRPGSEATPGDILEQMPTLRDAVFSGMTLDIFNRHPEKVAMANCAQLINCLNSLYLAHEDQFVVTPVGRVFELYAAHQGGQSVRAVFDAPEVKYDRDGTPATFWGLQGSASLHNKTLVLTVANPHVTQAHETEIMVRGAKPGSATMTVLTAPDIHAHNTFAQPNVVLPRPGEVKATASSVVVTIPAAAVVSLQIELG
ncbi:MAG TPA: alpha-L-arabinofuranosidase C-terminal domain-containing protein [Candidatus Eisenbacteria bacterium]|nr:alpha-L-arabinofuranosidase C-terminal domain-containing protein [Candidatus Eisenbacteria bacterium]